MKNLFAQTFASLLLGVLTLAPLAQAQQAQRIIKVNIPFEFSVGDREFPAGSYSLASSAPPLLDVRDAKGHTLVRLLTNSVETQTAPATPLLEFISDGGRYSLAEVWQENDLIGQQVPQSKAWAKVAKRHAHTETIAASNSR
jgi:hypothetical protein